MRTTICLPASLSHPCLPVPSHLGLICAVLFPCSAQAWGCHSPSHLARLPSLTARKSLTLQECCCSFPNTGPKVPVWKLPLNSNWQLVAVGTVESCESVLLGSFEFLSAWEDWAEREQEVCCVPVKPAAPSRLRSWNWDGWVLVLLRV